METQGTTSWEKVGLTLLNEDEVDHALMRAGLKYVHVEQRWIIPDSSDEEEAKTQLVESIRAKEKEVGKQSCGL